VSIIDVEGGAANLSEESVTTVTFTDFNEGGSRSAELPEDVRVYGPDATVAQDLEPEYVVVSSDSTTAFVVLQEANAYAEIDLNAGTVTAIRAFGFKDHSQPGNGLDAGGDDGTINIANWNVFGMYQPDAMALYEAEETQYLITANEGDTRDYDGYSEEGELGESSVDAEAFPNLDGLTTEEAIGGLGIVTSIGDTDGDGDLDKLYIPGGRSFSVWNALSGELVFDSGDQIEHITSETYPDDFNADNAENGSFDDRSDNKGPEPEGLALGVIGDTTYAFIALERIGGIMVYDLTDPTAPAFVTYVNNRDFAGDAEAGTAGDLGPEGLVFIPAADSPNGNNLLVVANEVSGTTTIYQINSVE
jgi:2',3'-cyclic-nucleotide 2'-phosphodiesterase / 3'-nucleotidase / 5'-nucleotidase